MASAFIAASTARRSAGGKGKPAWASSFNLGKAGSSASGVMRVKATSIPSAEVPLMMPATVIAVNSLMPGDLLGKLLYSTAHFVHRGRGRHRRQSVPLQVQCME